MPAPGLHAAAVGPLLYAGCAGGGLQDRRPWQAIQAEAPPVTPSFDVRGGGRAAGRALPSQVRQGRPKRAAPARAGHARDLLPSEQGPRERDRRGGTSHAPAATTMKLEVVHSTLFRYSGPIAETVMEVRLRPMDGLGQRCLEFELDVSSGVKPRSYLDGYGNNVHYFNLVRPHSRLSVSSRSVVETGGEPDADPGEDLVQDFLRFRSPVKDVEGVRQLAGTHKIADPFSGPAVEQMLDNLTLAISRDFAYDRAVTNVYSAVDEVLALRAGVCQDFAHLLIAVARTMGVPARYVSGYIHQPGDSGTTTASHAWAEAWVPGRGWIGYDATHPVRTSEHHVRLAVGRDYSDAAPTRGIYVGSAARTMDLPVSLSELSGEVSSSH